MPYHLPLPSAYSSSPFQTKSFSPTDNSLHGLARLIPLLRQAFSSSLWQCPYTLPEKALTAPSPRKRLVGYHQLGINFDNPAKALALGASANRRIKRKSRWGRGTEFPSVNGRAETFVEILEQVALEISCLGLSMSVAYGQGNSFGKPALRSFVGHQPITDHEDRIAFPPCLHQVFDPVKSLVFKRADMPAFGKKPKELGGLQSSRSLCKKAKGDMFACKFGNNRFGLCIRGFKANGFAAAGSTNLAAWANHTLK